jgi:hypothetical protein
MKRQLAHQHGNDPSTRIVEEMGVWAGTVRIDIAVINGALTGFELKSDRDTLSRLPGQADLYSRVFDEVTLVVGKRHIKKASELIPSWWGIIMAEQAEEIRLTVVRPAMRNPSPEPYLVAELLWKEEAIAILESHGLAKGWRSKRVKAIHERLASELPFSVLADQVRETLKARTSWLSREQSCNQFDMPVHA